MRLSTKMILLYSVVIAAALGTFFSYTIQSTMEGANKFTAARFANMSASISLDIQQDIDMMHYPGNPGRQHFLSLRPEPICAG